MNFNVTADGEVENATPSPARAGLLELPITASSNTWHPSASDAKIWVSQAVSRRRAFLYSSIEGNTIEFTWTRQLVAEVSLIGMGVDVLGGCYLAYDLLGGRRGPLRTIARAAGYITLFFVGYALVFGPRYAVVAAIGMGVLLAVEYRDVDRVGAMNQPDGRPDRARSILFGFLRGVVLGVAAMTILGVRFGAWFAALSGAGLSASYVLGFAPTDDYETQERPHLSAHKIVASLLRALAVTVSGVLAGLITRFTGAHWAFLGLRLGLAAGVVSALVGIFSPVVEWRIDHLPEKALGVLGLCLIFVGVFLQSVQYWVVVFDIAVR